MAHPQIILPRCFSSLCSPSQLLISGEPLDDLSQLKFYGEDGTSITEHISNFLKFYEIDDENISCVLFFLTLEGRVNRLCHTLPLASIHSFDQFFEEIHQAFDRYDYRDVSNKINQLRMNPNESIDDFYKRFLYLCYEFLGENLDWDFLKVEFESLARISLHGEYKPPDVYVPQTFVNCETPLIPEEEPTIPFVPCPPPFRVPIWVPPCDNVEVGKSINQIPNPSSQPSPHFP